MPQDSAAAPAQPNDPQRSEGAAGFRGPWWKRPRNIVLLVAVAVVGTGIGLLAHYWPFSRQTVVQSLEEEFDGKLSVEHFRTIYFPHPGCVAEGLTLVHPGSPPGSLPFAVARRFTLHAAYTDLFLRPGYISSISVEGLHIRIPPRSQRTQQSGSPAGGGANNQSGQTGNKSRQQQSSSKTRVGQVIANDAVVEVARGGNKPPLRFQIHSLTLKSASHKTGFFYDVAFTNSLPPSEIQAKGHFGPWNISAPAETPVSGSYQLKNGNLGVFDGVSGTLAAQDSFRGVLNQIVTHGHVDVPDFHVTRSIHKVHLRSDYDVVVNAFNGDVQLRRVEASVLQTTIFANGSIANRPGGKAKTASIDLSVRNGRVQDVLLLFTQDPTPSFNGATDFHAHVEVPPEGKPFLKELQLTGEFRIADGRFMHTDTRKQIIELSDRSSGKKPPKSPPVLLSQDIASKVSAHVNLKDGVAALPDLSFVIPGAAAVLHGTFNLLNEHIDFHGSLKTDASFSQTASGVKSILLKPFDAIFKKKPKGANIPVKLDGTYSNPHPGVDFAGDGNNKSAAKPRAAQESRQ